MDPTLVSEVSKTRRSASGLAEHITLVMGLLVYTTPVSP